MEEKGPNNQQDSIQGSNDWEASALTSVQQPLPYYSINYYKLSHAIIKAGSIEKNILLLLNPGRLR